MNQNEQETWTEAGDVRVEIREVTRPTPGVALVVVFAEEGRELVIRRSPEIAREYGRALFEVAEVVERKLAGGSPN
jgi:hypothetical protein